MPDAAPRPPPQRLGGAATDRDGPPRRRIAPDRRPTTAPRQLPPRQNTTAAHRAPPPRRRLEADFKCPEWARVVSGWVGATEPPRCVSDDIEMLGAMLGARTLVSTGGTFSFVAGVARNDSRFVAPPLAGVGDFDGAAALAARVHWTMAPRHEVSSLAGGDGRRTMTRALACWFTPGRMPNHRLVATATRVSRNRPMSARALALSLPLSRTRSLAPPLFRGRLARVRRQLLALRLRRGAGARLQDEARARVAPNKPGARPDRGTMRVRRGSARGAPRGRARQRTALQMGRGAAREKEKKRRPDGGLRRRHYAAPRRPQPQPQPQPQPPTPSP